MLPKRVIPCLDVDGGRVVKGTEFVDMRDVGDPVELATRYETEGADELVLLDTTATSGNRMPQLELVRRAAAEVFIPLTVGGGLRSVTDGQALLDAGADKLAVNSAALREPILLKRFSDLFGSQCTALAIDAKYDGNSGWEVYAAGGRKATGRQAVEWAREGVARGVGEILLTSMDRDGTNNGYDLALTRAVTEAVDVPVIASGGAGHPDHYVQAIRQGGAQAVLVASQLHSGRTTAASIKEQLSAEGIPIRPLIALSSDALSQERDGSRPEIAIVDYGMGNRYSVQKALERIGANGFVSDDLNELVSADGLVIPGVGAFRPAMERLQAAGLDSLIRREAALGKPVLGICLGEQLLFDGSQEDGWCKGLGLIPGLIQEIETPIRPNIGWCEVDLDQSDTLVTGLGEQEYFYHVHRYAGVTEQGVIGRTRLPYVGNDSYGIPTIVRRGNTWGVQFHPEKSGPAGLRLLKNFASLCLSEKTSLQ